MCRVLFLFGCFILVVHSNPAHKWRVESPTDDNNEDTKHHSELNIIPGQCYCGVPNDVTPESDMDPRIVFSDRVVGGDKSLLGEYPWQVSLLLQGDISNHICGGTLVSSLHIITAAHCTAGISADSLAVAVGYTNLSSSAQDRFIIGVQEIRDHPNYRGQETHFENDISILVLAEEVDLSAYPHIKPACLPTSRGARPEDGWYVNKTAVVSGWGLTNYFYGTYPQHLQDVEVTVYGRRNCKGLSDYINDSHFCAGHDEGGKDACQGDSGGPLMVEDADNNMAFTLIGVVSAGSSCADKNYPGLYTDVKKYCTDGWIEEQISGANLCSIPPVETVAVTTITVQTTTTTTTTTTDNPTTSNLEKTYPENLAVIIIGGDGYSFGTKVEVWSPNSSCNKQLADLPDYRTYHDSALINGTPIVCGGTRTLKSCLKMNSNQNWEPFTSPSVYRSNQMMVSYGPGMIMIGGTWSKTVEYFDQEKSTLLDGKTPRLENACAALTDRDSIVLTGGKGGETYRVQAWEFSLVTGIWDRLPDIPEGGRYQHACTFLSQGERRGIMIAGGSSGFQVQSTTFFLDLGLKQWFKLPDMSTKRWGARMVNLQGRIFVIGGGDGRNYIKDVEEFDIQNFVWKKTEDGIVFPRSDFSVVVVPAANVGCDDYGIIDIIDPRK